MIGELRRAVAKAARLQTRHLAAKSLSNLPPEKFYQLLERFDVFTASTKGDRIRLQSWLPDQHFYAVKRGVFSTSIIPTRFSHFLSFLSCYQFVLKSVAPH